MRRNTHGDLFSEVPKLDIRLGPTPYGPPPDRPLENIGDISDPSGRFALTEMEKELLQIGYVENRSTRNDRVLARRDALPERIRCLIEDVGLLWSQSFFSSDRWEFGLVPPEDRFDEMASHAEILGDEEITTIEAAKAADVDDSTRDPYETPFDAPADLWDEIIQTPRVAHHEREDVFFSGGPAFGPEIQFGFELGSLLRSIRPDDYQSHFQSRWKPAADIAGGGLIWGVLLAFLGGPKQSVHEERDRLTDLFELFRELHDERVSQANKMPSVDEVNDARYDEATLNAVEDMGFSPHPIVLNEVEHHRLPGDTEEGTLNIAKRVVREIVEVTPLTEVEQLRESLEADRETIAERSRRGVESARTVLDTVWDIHIANHATEEDSSGESAADSTADSPTNTGEKQLTSKLVGNEHGINTSLATEVLNRLASTTDPELWTTEAIVRKNDSGERGTSWELTAYGQLLCEIEFRRDGETGWLYHYAIGPEELSLLERRRISAALDE